MTVLLKPALYTGTVWHKRTRPKVHAFRYPAYYLLLDVDDFSAEQSTLPWCLSLNRANLFSVYEKDFGPRDGKPLRSHVESLLTGPVAPARIMMLTMPRLFGYAFNPITVYFCHDADGALSATIYEVHNTFGEAHCYVFEPGREMDAVPMHEARKTFHVSPFYPVEGHYKFSLCQPEEQFALTIRYLGADGKHDLTACLKAQRRPLTSSALMKVFASIPLVTFKVTAAIHYEALRLFLKRLKVFSKPPQSDQRTELARADVRDMKRG